MRRALVACVALLASGCMFRVQTSRNAPGIVDLEKPPAPLTRVETPADPGGRGIAFYGAATEGIFGQSRNIGGVFGAELGFFPYSLQASGRSWFDDGPLRAFGGAVGWSIYRTSNHQNGDTFGPLYAEARAMIAISRGLGMTRFGLGPAFNPQSLNAGPQTSACIGVHPAFFMFCLRGSYMFGGEGPEIYAYFETSTFLEVGWSK